MDIESGLKNAFAPFASIAKSSTVEIDLQKVAQSVAKAVSETSTVSITKAEDLLKATDPLCKTVDGIVDLLDSSYLDPVSGGIFANGASPLAETFKAEMCKECGKPASLCKCAMAKKAEETTKASATKFKKTAVRDDTIGTVPAVDSKDPNSSAELVTTALRNGTTKKELAHDGFQAGKEPSEGDVDDQYTARGAGKATDPQTPEMRYTAGSGIANDKDPKFQYTNHEPGPEHDNDFSFDQPAAEGQAKSAKTSKAQYDGIAEEMGQVNNVDRKPKPIPAPNQPESEFDAGVQSVDTLGKGFGQDTAQSVDEPVEEESEEDVESTKAKKKGVAKLVKKGVAPAAPKADDDVWPSDMSPKRPPTSKAERLTRNERPLPARAGGDSAKINKRYQEKRDRAFNREGRTLS